LKEAVNFEYLIAGTGPDKEKIDKLINNYGLQNYVKYLGWIEINDLINTYQDSDIFLHASRFDPYPNAVLEAMACGLVVVASNTAGSANDRIVDSKNGFIFKSGNSDHLFVKIIEAIQSKSFEDIQKNARKTALEWPVNYNISLIKRCLKLI
jgi:glycosyltransferase involved in cell wall biosynthesis